LRTVLLVLADEVDRKRGEVELDAVVDNVVREHFREDVAHVRHARVAEAKEVEIAGRSVWLAGPECEERGAFEYELLRMSRGREAEQQALVRVPRSNNWKSSPHSRAKRRRRARTEAPTSVGGFFMQGPQGMGA
jgi:hypothetical protein